MRRCLPVDADRNCAIQGYAVKLALEIAGVDIANSLVLGRAVIPEGDATRFPVEANAKLRTDAVLPQEFE